MATFGDWLRGRKLKAPQVPPRRAKETLGGGHRGVAMGDAAAPDRSLENIAKWENVPASEVEAFVYAGKVLPMHSTNVEAAQYLFGEGKLIVKYLGDGYYEYDDVSETEAVLFAKAQSKGTWVWDNLRVRGSKTQHRKSFRNVAGFRAVTAD